MLAALVEGRKVSATSSGALTEGQNVTLSFSSGSLTATAATAGTRVDGVVMNPVATGIPVAILLKPGTFLSCIQADGAITAGAAVFAGAAGVGTATGNGEFLGYALEAATTAGDLIRIVGKPATQVKLFNKVLDSTDVSNGYVTFTHTFGANPVFWMGQCYAVTTGAARVISGVTFPTTDTIRFAITSSAAGDSMNALVSRTAT